MVEAYLRWKYHCSSNATPTQPPPSSTTGVTEANSLPSSRSPGGDLNHIIHSDAAPTTSTRMDPPLPHPPDDPGDSARSFNPPLPDIIIEIAAIDIYTLSTSIKISVSSVGMDTTASALTELGFIGNVPFKPSVAVSIRTLELYHVLRRRKLLFSVEAFVKVISDLYLVCPTPTTIPRFS